MSMWIVASVVFVLAALAGFNPPGGMWKSVLSTDISAVLASLADNPVAYERFCIAIMTAVLASLTVWMIWIIFPPAPVTVWILMLLTSIAVIAMALSVAIAVAAVGSYPISPLSIFWLIVLAVFRVAGLV